MNSEETKSLIRTACGREQDAVQSLACYLILGNLHRISENCPEHSRVARRCSQGPYIAVVLVRALRQKFFNVEAWDAHLLAWRDILRVRVPVYLLIGEA